ncbi:hypothetical protein IV203_018043 [Nitzschia inconspicua]|uniref:Uncharacterized protein n=1 Tax=Nitzschia inconspicua TaxID=303405 RepID=A0A9K3M2P3_9STRA|nr:hypothetical protein IV203_018043 [Nitzschia inconspicua]
MRASSYALRTAVRSRTPRSFPQIGCQPLSSLAAQRVLMPSGGCAHFIYDPALNRQQIQHGRSQFSTSVKEARRKAFMERQKRKAERQKHKFVRKDVAGEKRGKPRLRGSTRDESKTAKESRLNSDRYENPPTVTGKTESSGTASSLMENWEDATIGGKSPSSRGRNPHSSALSSVGDRPQQEYNYKQMRLKEIQRTFFETLSEYRDVWNPSSQRSGSKTEFSQSWQRAFQFQHPPLSIVSWEMVVQSEELFRLLCTLQHDLFVACASLAEYSQNSSFHFEGVHNYSGDISPSAGQDLMCSLLTFWESMRKERTIVVNHCRPKIETSSTESESSVADTKRSAGWMNLLESVIGVQNSSNQEIPIIAHEDSAYGPTPYHYTKLVGRLFFNFDLLVESKSYSQSGEGEESGTSTILSENRAMMEKRANAIQVLVDQCQSAKNISSKAVRLLIRAHAEVGTLEAAQQGERVYNTYPQFQKNLLWHVLLGYLNVIEEQVKSIKKSSEHDYSTLSKIGFPAKQATNRICELVSGKHSSEPSEFQACAGLGFQALTTIAPYAETMLGFHDRLHSLGILKFGPKAWEALIQPKSDSLGAETLNRVLHPRDHKFLNQLILIYAMDEKYLDRALSILDIAFERFSLQELKESFNRETFHSLLQSLVKRQKERVRKESGQCSHSGVGVSRESDSDPELEIAFHIADKMMVECTWFPNNQTFFHLFRLTTRSGYDSDRVRTRLEACRFLSNDLPIEQDGEAILAPPYPLNPVKAAKFALNAWVAVAEKNGGEVPPGESDPSERAWAILSSLRIASRPLFLPAETVMDIYDPTSAPDTPTYILVLKICSRVRSKTSRAVTLKVLDIVEEEGIISEGSICLTLVRAINNSSDMEDRVKLTKRVYELVTQDEKAASKGSIQKGFEGQIGYFRRQHPILYEKYLAPLLDSEESEADPEA